MRADLDRLADVLEAIERIERHTSAGRGAFDTDELVQVWVVRHLQIIGDAVAGQYCHSPEVVATLEETIAGGHRPGPESCLTQP